MKRVLTYLILAFSVLSCREKDVLPKVEAEISFAVPEVVETKSILIENVDQMEIMDGKVGFSVFGARYILGNGGEYEKFMDDLKVYREKYSEEWVYEGERYYWSPGASHKFFALYPYYNPDSDEYDLGLKYEIDKEKQAIKVTGNEGLINTGFDEDGKNLCPDILYGVQHYPEPYSIGEKRERIRFIMSHALAAVSFRFRNASEHTIESVKGISPENHIYMAGFKTTATNVFLSEDKVAWEIKSDVANSFAVSEITSPVSPGYYYAPSSSDYWFTALMIPQNFADYPESPSLSFEVSFGTAANEKQYTINFKDYAVHSTAADAFSFLPGYHYEYNINVTERTVYCDVRIVPWIEDEPIKLN